jgi:hypothetical protein
MSASEDFASLQDQLIKVQRDARKALDARRTELAVVGMQREIAVWSQIRDLLAATPLDTEALIRLLLEAHTLEQAKRKNFYM